jgi:hypothetical protein
MAEPGRAEAASISGETPFADRLGERGLADSEEGSPDSGRLALEIVFDSGRVRCEPWSGARTPSATPGSLRGRAK